MNRLSFAKTERSQARHLKRALQLPTAVESLCSPFTIRELDTAMHTIQSKGTVGPGDIPPTFTKALGPMAKAELLSIFNENFSKGVVSGIWKEATILPLKKAGKPPGSSPPTDLPASHSVLSRQWRVWCTIACKTWPRQQDGFAENRLASTSYAHARTKFSEPPKPSVTASRPPGHNSA